MSFCNQKSISGKTKMPTKDEVIKIIEEHLKKDHDFFHGLFLFFNYFILPI